MTFYFSKHALEQMKLRGISKKMVEEMLANPNEIKEENNKKVYQSLVEHGKYLIRCIVNHRKNPQTIITVYKTSKINKYYEGKIR